MAKLDHPFARLCLEVVRRCGSDMAAIERVMAQEIAGMDAESQTRIRRDLALVLAGGLSEGPQEDLS